MAETRTAWIVVVGLAIGALSGSSRAASAPADEQTVIHVLNRIGFGPRPGDVQRVKMLGVTEYINEQLHPERLPDAGLPARLAGLTTIELSSREIAEKYERPLLAIRLKARQSAAGTPGTNDPASPSPETMAMQQQANTVVVELAEQKLLRAIYSDRQLQEVLTDFWFNHFNVDARKGPDRFFLTEYEREVIRPHVLGSFRDLLEATAKSPAMLFYLDNWMSADPNGPHADANGRPFRARPFGRGRFLAPPQAAQNTKAPRGLNENYGRELMELHTLGVDGGYTQKDVTEVARAFTGWTLSAPRLGGGFRFEPRIHDDGEKVVLGHRLKAGGGIHDGEEVLDLLAEHPATARFIAIKLTRRFVGDEPPASLVDRVAKRFHDTKGDLREVMRSLLTSPEFLGEAARRTKVKTPFEFVASAVRATGTEVADARALVRQVGALGMPLFQCQPPTGYKDTAETWANTGAIVQRMNFALALASGKLPGINPPATISEARTSASSADALVASILSGSASDTTRSTVARATTAAQMTALTLGSPEFQRR